MASAKRTPQVSRISRGRTVAYARKQKSADGGGEGGPEEPAPDAQATETDEGAAAPDATPAAAAAPSGEPPSGAPPESAATTTAPRPDAAPPEEPRDATRGGVNRPVDTRVATAPMPAQAPIGVPPGMPHAASSSAPVADAAEDPTRMPGPREIPEGHPDDPASPPGRVPPGDSRSLRRRADRHEFALVYRQGSFVIRRVGVVGTRGQWRVVEYPTPSMASHAYAKECSRFVSDGFSDYRE